MWHKAIIPMPLENSVSLHTELKNAGKGEQKERSRYTLTQTAYSLLRHNC